MTVMSNEYFGDTDTLRMLLREPAGALSGIDHDTPEVVFFVDEAGRVCEVMVDCYGDHSRGVAPERFTLSHAVRASLGLSRAAWAAMLDINPRTVEGWEQGRFEPDAAALRLIEVAAVHPEYFLKPA